MQTAKKIAVKLGVRQQLNMGQDHKNLGFYTLITLLMSVSSCFALEIVAGALWVGFMQEKRLGTSVCGPTLKESCWLYIKRLVNDCTFIGFQLI